MRSTPSSTCLRSLSSETPLPLRTTSCHTSRCLITYEDTLFARLLRAKFAHDTLHPDSKRTEQDYLDPDLRGRDAEILSEYEEELRLYEEELQKERELACAELFVKAKAAKAQEQAELVGYLKEPGASPGFLRSALKDLHAAALLLCPTISPPRPRLTPDGPPAGKLTSTSNPSERARLLSSQLAQLRARLSELVATPVPHDTTSNVPAVAPWATSRSAFVNWAAEKKAAPGAAGAAAAAGGGAGGGGGNGAAAPGGGGQLPEDAVVEKFQEEVEQMGEAVDAKVSRLGAADLGSALSVSAEPGTDSEVLFYPGAARKHGQAMTRSVEPLLPLPRPVQPYLLKCISVVVPQKYSHVSLADYLQKPESQPCGAVSVPLIGRRSETRTGSG